MITRKFGYERSLRKNALYAGHQFISLRRLRKTTPARHESPMMNKN